MSGIILISVSLTSITEILRSCCCHGIIVNVPAYCRVPARICFSCTSVLRLFILNDSTKTSIFVSIRHYYINFHCERIYKSATMKYEKKKKIQKISNKNLEMSKIEHSIHRQVYNYYDTANALTPRIMFNYSFIIAQC